MINIKVDRRASNGNVVNVSSTGHANEVVCAAVSTLMQCCGNGLEDIKSGKMTIENDGYCVIEDIRANKPAVAIANVLARGLESLAAHNKYSISYQEFFID